MRGLNRTKRTRLKLSIYTNVFLGVVTMSAMHYDMESLASTSIAGILTITTMYIGGDTYRKSQENV